MTHYYTANQGHSAAHYWLPVQTLIYRETSRSADLSLPEQCHHWLGESNQWTSLILFYTNGCQGEENPVLNLFKFSIANCLTLISSLRYWYMVVVTIAIRSGSKFGIIYYLSLQQVFPIAKTRLSWFNFHEHVHYSSIHDSQWEAHTNPLLDTAPEASMY